MLVMPQECYWIFFPWPMRNPLHLLVANHSLTTCPNTIWCCHKNASGYKCHSHNTILWLHSTIIWSVAICLAEYKTSLGLLKKTAFTEHSRQTPSLYSVLKLNQVAKSLVNLVLTLYFKKINIMHSYRESWVDNTVKL